MTRCVLKSGEEELFGLAKEETFLQILAGLFQHTLATRKNIDSPVASLQVYWPPADRESVQGAYLHSITIVHQENVPESCQYITATGQ
jgi:hypothetical protein